MIGPIWSKDEANATKPYLETKPYVGFNPTTPQKADGWRIDPPVSLPRAQGTIPAATAAARAALHILKSEPERRENLWKITNYALDCFRQAGFEIGDTESPIIPLYVRDTDKTFEVTKLAFDEGIFINPVIPPACAPQDTLVRVALMATHTKEQVDYAVIN